MTAINSSFYFLTQRLLLYFIPFIQKKGKKGVAKKKILCFISYNSLGYKLVVTFFNIFA